MQPIVAYLNYLFSPPNQPMEVPPELRRASRWRNVDELSRGDKVIQQVGPMTFGVVVESIRRSEDGRFTYLVDVRGCAHMFKANSQVLQYFGE